MPRSISPPPCRHRQLPSIALPLGRPLKMQSDPSGIITRKWRRGQRPVAEYSWRLAPKYPVPPFPLPLNVAWRIQSLATHCALQIEEFQIAIVGDRCSDSDLSGSLRSPRV